MINWGIIGLGHMSYRFINAIKEIKSTKLIAVASLSKKKSTDLIKELGIDESFYFNNYEDLIKSPDIDAIYIDAMHIYDAVHIGWAGRSRKEAMQLTLPHSVFGSGSSLELMTAAPLAANGGAETAEARDTGVMLAVGSALAVLTGMFALLRVRRRANGAMR